MTFVVALGLENHLAMFEDPAEDVARRARALLSLVERGYATRLREVVWEGAREVAEARVYEAFSAAGRATGRWLPAEEAAPIAGEVAQLFEARGSFVAFPYGAGHVIETGDLNFVADGPSRLPPRLDIEGGSFLARPLSACHFGGDRGLVVSALDFVDLAGDQRLVLSAG